MLAALNAFGESAPSNEAGVAVPYPRLSAGATATNVMMTWSNPASFLTLRTSTSLVPPVAWQPITNAPVYQDGVWQLYWLPDDAVRFFRLSSQ